MYLRTEVYKLGDYTRLPHGRERRLVAAMETLADRPCESTLPRCSATGVIVSLCLGGDVPVEQRCMACLATVALDLWATSLEES